MDHIRPHLEKARAHTRAMRPIVQALKPSDWLALTFLLVTLPLALTAQVWGGIVFRLVLIPSVVFGRYYFVNSAGGTQTRLSKLFLFVLDIYPLIACIYMYGEDGKTLQFLYPDRETSFWDDAIKHADAALLGVDVKLGSGTAIRSRTSETFNKIVGEYLHFAYFAFYIILVGTPLFGWLVLPREYFDRLMTAQTLVYLFCCGAYLFFPTAGPYWAYPDQRPEPEKVGYIFSHLTHVLVGGGSSLGTAFPSGHCSITTSAMVVSAVYMPRLFALYLFIGPALVVATVWGGFHYFYDAMFGVLLGLIGAVVGIAFARILHYIPPTCDTAYSTQFNMRVRAFMDATPSVVHYTYLPEFDSEPGDFEYTGSGLYSKKPALASIPALPPRRGSYTMGA